MRKLCCVSKLHDPVTSLTQWGYLLAPLELRNCVGRNLYHSDLCLETGDSGLQAR